MNINSLLELIAVDLNDAAPGHEFTTWSREQIRAYVEEAVQVAFIERPDLFIETRVIRLQPCTYIQDTCDCTQVRRVLGQTTKDGRILRLLRPKKNSEKIQWHGRTCPVSPKNFELKEYSIDTLTDKLWVYPMVPAGMDVYVAVECSVAPSENSTNYDIPTELRAAVVQWVLYRAKMVDAENNTGVLAAAKEHQDTFWKLLTAQVVMQDLTAENRDAQSTVSSGVRRSS